jgi:hypothetical protein
VFFSGFTDALLDLSQCLFGEEDLVVAPRVGPSAMRAAISSDASGSSFLADHILMDSEHNNEEET